MRISLYSATDSGIASSSNTTPMVSRPSSSSRHVSTIASEVASNSGVKKRNRYTNILIIAKETT
ncbi:hypothetical protein MKX03_011734, partial [Papaver bracteatum]